jgi:hypothetical protein
MYHFAQNPHPVARVPENAQKDRNARENAGERTLRPRSGGDSGPLTKPSGWMAD